jgi:hypothetical protein
MVATEPVAIRGVCDEECVQASFIMGERRSGMDRDRNGREDWSGGQCCSKLTFEQRLCGVTTGDDGHADMCDAATVV